MERVLIANRGEIASRLSRTLKKMGFYTVGLATNWDINLPYVHDLDAIKYVATDNVSEVFLNPSFLVGTAGEFSCKYIHPGYGFLAENFEFFEACGSGGITVIGPPKEAVRDLGSKLKLKEVCEKLQVPTLKEISVEKDNLAGLLPVIIKGSDTGGGRGMRIVKSLSELETLLESAQQEVKSFGGGRVFCEPYLENVKHIEIQVIVDKRGNVTALFERDCSVQRNFQKVVEETPCPTLSESLRNSLRECAIRIASSLKHHSIYTYEFLVQGDNFYLSEINTRLQVEHTVTEELYMIDLVEIQTLISVCPEYVVDTTFDRVRESSIQLRLYAEDTSSFKPSSGYVQELEFNVMPSRLELTYKGGNFVSPFYDPMIAKIIETGSSRGECVKNLKDVLENVTVSGIETNLEFLLWVLNNQSFLNGDYTTSLPSSFRTIKKNKQKDTGTLPYEEKNEMPEHVSPVLGCVSRIQKKDGTVQKGEPVLFIESMKILHPVFANKAGTIELLVNEGDVVKKGQLLFRVT
ncbi:MAG: biotin carboxylase [Deltaproteobacteria bacterium]|nr:biotin carboxylase [Deltaproteobacteria bacterium]MCX7952598.1 biotin carboxylase [Deltaproteobacteria bacterium]